MRFSVTATDLGPISDATLGIAPLTVFVGDNNTGKTTLAHVARAVFRCLEPVTCHVSELLTEADKDQFEQALTAGGELQIPAWLIEKIAERSSAGLRAGGLDDRFRQRIAKALSANHLRQLRRSGSSKEPRVEAAVDMPVAGTKTIFSTHGAPENMADAFAGEIRAILDEPLVVEPSGSAMLDLNLAFRKRLSTILPKPDFSSAYYLPVAQESNLYRTTLDDNDEVTYRAIDTWSDGLDGFFENDYHLDCVNLRALTAMQEIMGGKVVFEPSSDGPPCGQADFVGRHGRIPLSLASSMVQRLAPLYLLLAYGLGLGDMLVVESPEALMEPHRARQFTQALVRIANAGVTVLLTTQSPGVLEGIADSMRVHLAQRSDTKYAGISPADVAVNCFSRADEQSPVDVAGIEAGDLVDQHYIFESLVRERGQ